jgi:hypothetical protein
MRRHAMTFRIDRYTRSWTTFTRTTQRNHGAARDTQGAGRVAVRIVGTTRGGGALSEQDLASDKRGVRCPNVQRLFDLYRPDRSLASLAEEYGVSLDTLRRYRRFSGPSAFTRPPARDVMEMYARVLGCPEYEVAGAFFLDFYPFVGAGPIERVNKLLALVTAMKSPAQVEELIRYAREIVAGGHGESRAETPRI